MAGGGIVPKTSPLGLAGVQNSVIPAYPLYWCAVHRTLPIPRSTGGASSGALSPSSPSIERPSQASPANFPPIPLALQTLTVADQTLSILMADCDAVMQMYIDAGQGDRDPYWTCLWPSSIAMAQEILRRPHLVKNRRIADLGCGLGLAGLAAALAGAAEVVFLDREPLALQCALLNAQLCGVGAVDDTVADIVALSGLQIPPDLAASLPSDADGHRRSDRRAVVSGRLLDWSDPSVRGSFDVVLACDVLYEAYSVDPVANVAPRLLGKSSGGKQDGVGRLLLADPPLRARHNRERFIKLIRDQGYIVEECGERQAHVWEEMRQGYADVPITFMAFRQGCVNDTVGVKFEV